MANFLIHLMVFIWGTCIGSFLNVVIYRLPNKISLVHPPSRCPKCLHPLGKTENIPVVGWLWLQGKCRWCHTPISPRYPLIEALTGFLFALVYHQFGFTWLSLGYGIMLSWLMALAWIDFDTMTLPNSLTQSGLVIGIIWQGCLGFTVAGFRGLLQYIFLSIFGAVLGIWLFDIIRILGNIIFRKPAMGGGDPKLVAMIGAWLGWQNVLLTGFLACLIGSIIGGGSIVFKLHKREQEIPFGPFLVMGALASLFWGDFLLAHYLEYTGL